MTEKLRPFHQLTVGRILIVEAASLNGGEGLPCVGCCWPTAGQSCAHEPSWWQLWEHLVAPHSGMGKVLPSRVRARVRNSPPGTKARGEQRVLAACGIHHAAACGGTTLEQEKAGEGRSDREELLQTDKMLPTPTLWATGSREEGEKLGKE